MIFSSPKGEGLGTLPSRLSDSVHRINQLSSGSSTSDFRMGTKP